MSAAHPLVQPRASELKETELGLLPADWGVEPVESFAVIATGERNTQDRIDDGAYPFFVRSQTVERINSYSFDGEAILTAGDGVGTGKIFHYINGRFDIHQRVYRMSDFRPDVNGYYFFLYFSANFYARIMQMTAKSSVDSVRREMIARMLIALPPRREQDGIAEALLDAGALIESLETLITKKRAIKQGAMQELLSGRRRLPGFSGSWQTTKLGSLGVFLKGSGVRKDQAQSGTLPCVRYGELYTDHENVVRAFRSFISRDVASTATRIRSGDLLFAGSGETKEEIGKCVAVLNVVEAYAGGDIIILRVTDQDAAFLGYALNEPAVQRQKASKGQGDAVVHIGAKSLGSIDVLLPARAEQSAISRVLDDMDEELAALDDRLAKARQIKQGMMQGLLTGHVRLI